MPEGGKGTLLLSHEETFFLTGDGHLLLLPRLVRILHRRVRPRLLHYAPQGRQGWRGRRRQVERDEVLRRRLHLLRLAMALARQNVGNVCRRTRVLRHPR